MAGLESPAQLTQRVVQPAAHRPGRDPELGRDIGVRAVPQDGLDHDVPVDRAEPGQGVDQLVRSSTQCPRAVPATREVGSGRAAAADTGGRRAPARPCRRRRGHDEQPRPDRRAAGSKVAQDRQARTSASWAASSASAGSPRTRRARAIIRRRYAASAARRPASVHSPAQPSGRHEAGWRSVSSSMSVSVCARTPSLIGNDCPSAPCELPIRCGTIVSVAGLLERQVELQLARGCGRPRPRADGVPRCSCSARPASARPACYVPFSAICPLRSACSPVPARTC